jgi:transcriptional regulator with XRE-family HTH domain
MKTKGSPDEIDKVIARNLKHYRKQQGISQSELAKVLDVSFQQIQKYESAKNRVSASALYFLSKSLGVPICCFFSVITHDKSSTSGERFFF